MNRIISTIKHSVLKDTEITDTKLLLTFRWRSVETDYPRQFILPSYQRAYDWDKEQIDVLVEDIYSFKQKYYENQKGKFLKYYLGNIILIDTKENYQLLDGQQRITTYSLIFIVLQKYFQIYINEHSDNQDPQIQINVKSSLEYFQNLSDINNDDGRTLNIKKLSPLIYSYLTSDKEMLSYAYHHKIGDPLSNKRHKIVKGYKNILDKFAYLYNSQKGMSIKGLNEESPITQFRFLESFYNFFFDEFSEHLIILLNKGNEFDVFERINDRGKPLNSFWLTRNLISHHGEKLEENLKNGRFKDITRRFDENIQSNLKNKQRGHFNPELAKRFLLAHWNMNQWSDDQKTKSSETQYMYQFRDFAKIKFQRPQTFENFLESLEKSSLYLTEIKFEGPEIFKDQKNLSSKKDEIYNELDCLRATSFSQWYPLYLAVRQNESVNAEIILELLSIINKIYVNHNILNEYSPAAVEQFFCEQAKKLYKSNNLKYDLDSLYKAAEQFKCDNFNEKFEDLVCGNANSKYILMKIERHLNKSGFNFSSSIELEHIMPKKWDEHWKKVQFKNGVLNQDIWEENLNKLGNLTLLINKQNNKANNKDFIFKKDNIYNDETLKITKDDKIGIMKYDKWTDEEINKRQKLLSETAKSIWEF